MNEIKHRISLDVSRAGIQATIPFVKGNVNAHTIIATLRNGAEPVRFAQSEFGSLSAQFLMRRGNTNIFNSCEFIPVGADPDVYNAVVYNVTAQTLAEEGLFKAKFVITSGGGIIYSPEFQFSVLSNDESQLDVGDELLAMQNSVDECNQILQQMEDLRENLQIDYSDLETEIEKKADKDYVDTEITDAIGKSKNYTDFTFGSLQKEIAKLKIATNDDIDALFNGYNVTIQGVYGGAKVSPNYVYGSVNSDDVSPFGQFDFYIANGATTRYDYTNVSKIAILCQGIKDAQYSFDNFTWISLEDRDVATVLNITRNCTLYIKTYDQD